MKNREQANADWAKPLSNLRHELENGWHEINQAECRYWNFCRKERQPPPRDFESGLRESHDTKEKLSSF